MCARYNNAFTGLERFLNMRLIIIHATVPSSCIFRLRLPLGIFLENSKGVRAHRRDYHLIFFSPNSYVLQLSILRVELSHAGNALIVETCDVVCY
jgi:hypothetical protein